MTDQSRGIIYSATGKQFVAEAVTSARSSLRFNPVAHLIFCDAAPTKRIEGIEFVRFEPSGDPHLDKIRNIGKMQFEQTLFLDTDTYVVGNVEELFDLLQRFDVAAAHAPGYMKCNDTDQSEAFNDFNTGVIPYRRTSAAGDFLANWEKIYQGCPKWQPSDQPSFRRALWESSASFYALSSEYNYRTIFPGRLVGRAKILHGRSRLYEKLATQINAGVGRPRTFDAFPPEWDGGGRANLLHRLFGPRGER